MFTVDLHTHILPGIDDGASNADVSLALVKEEVQQGINQIVFTPHFDPLNDNIEDFLKRREDAWKVLQTKLSGTDIDNHIDFRKGAEIRYSTTLTDLGGLNSLCFSGTKVLLIEFSPHYYPKFVEDVIYRLQLKGFVILLAHVERFSWLRKEPELLYRLVCSGVYAQFNADAILNDSEKFFFIQSMLKCGLVHGIGSDTHNIEKRPPSIQKAESLLAKKTSPEMIQYLNQFSIDLLSGRLPDTVPPEKPKKGFFDFFRK